MFATALSTSSRGRQLCDITFVDNRISGNRQFVALAGNLSQEHTVEAHFSRVPPRSSHHVRLGDTHFQVFADKVHCGPVHDLRSDCFFRLQK